jgi:hypothetical protein
MCAYYRQHHTAYQEKNGQEQADYFVSLMSFEPISVIFLKYLCVGNMDE